MGRHTMLWLSSAMAVLSLLATGHAHADCSDRGEYVRNGYVSTRLCSSGNSYATFAWGDRVDQQGNIEDQFMMITCDNDNCDGTAGMNGYDGDGVIVCWAHTTGERSIMGCPPTLSYVYYDALRNPPVGPE